MKIYLIRHGETELNKQRRLQGQSDILLNDNGRRLAEITGRALSNVPFDYVFSSPLKRAYETAELMVGNRNIPIVTDVRIQEIGFGEYEGLCFHPDSYNIPDKEFLDFFRAPERYVVPPGGESFKEVIARTGEFWQEITEAEEYFDKTILISTHGCALKAILANIRQTPIEEFWGDGVHKNCAVTIIDKRGNNYDIAEGIVYYE